MMSKLLKNRYILKIDTMIMRNAGYPAALQSLNKYLKQ
jgi:hypothetical protein